MPPTCVSFCEFPRSCFTWNFGHTLKHPRACAPSRVQQPLLSPSCSSEVKHLRLKQQLRFISSLSRLELWPALHALTRFPKAATTPHIRPALGRAARQRWSEAKNEGNWAKWEAWDALLSLGIEVHLPVLEEQLHTQREDFPLLLTFTETVQPCNSCK